MSDDALAVWEARKGTWTNWASVSEVLQSPDHLRIARAWNELVSAGLAEGKISEGYSCMVLESRAH